MFCSKCGSQLPEGARFCGKCGKSVDMVMVVTPEYPAVKSGEASAPDTAGRRPGNGEMIVIGLITLAIAVVIMLFTGISAGYRKPIRQYLNGYEQFNANKIARSTAPFIYESNGYSMSDFKAELKEELELEKAYASEMGSFKISYTIEDVRKCGTYEISSVMDDMARYYGLDESDIPNVRKMKSVDLDITFKYKYDGEEYEETDSGTAYVGKIGSKWYIIELG